MSSIIVVCFLDAARAAVLCASIAARAASICACIWPCICCNCASELCIASAQAGG